MKWKTLPNEDAMWETTEDLLARFPNFNLEDKVTLETRGNDRVRRSARTPKKNPKFVD